MAVRDAQGGEVRAHFRAYPRRESTTTIGVRSDRGEQRLRLRDVGLGGAGLEGGELEIGAQVEVVFTAPNRWDPLVIRGRVAWARGARSGVAFDGTAERELYALFEMLGTQVFDR